MVTQITKLGNRSPPV